MPKIGANIYLRKDGRWEGRFAVLQPDGSKKYKSVYGKTYTEAKQKMELCKKNMRKSPDLPKCELTVEEALNLWLDVKQKKVKPVSYSLYKRIIKNHLIPYFNSVYMEHLAVAAITRYAKKLKADGLTDKTIRDIIYVLKAAVKLAGQYYYLPEAEAIRKLAVSDCLRKKEKLNSLRVVNNKVVDVSGNTLMYIARSGVQLSGTTMV